MRYLKACSVLITLLFLSPAANAVHWDLISRFCPQEILEIPPMLEEIPIPVGCEVVDCCPGCPGPGIDWKIRVDETLMQGASLRIEGMNEKNLRELKISGNAKITEKGEIKLGTGEISISGLPETVNGQVPVAFVSPQMNSSDQMDTQKMSAATRSGDEADIDGGIQIIQYRGPYRVNTFRSRYVLSRCYRPPTAVDKLKLTNNTSNDSAVAVLDYKAAGSCDNDPIHRVTNSANMGNILEKGACRSTVSVFSDDNAMSYEPNVTTWTNATGDVHTVDLQTIITVPVSVWVANNVLQVTAQNDIANTNLLYNQNNVGVQFAPTYTNYDGVAGATGTIGTWCPTAATVGALQGSAWYTAGQLNAYYVNSAFTGVNCGQDRNINFIGTTANLGSLPHEFGHAYGLRPSGSWVHTNGVAGFGNGNIMWGGGPGTRNNFTTAQSFRINTDTTSMLNTNGDRTGSTETCLPNANSNICPNLTLDSLPH